MAIQISRSLQLVLNAAFQKALQARHEYLTPEHMLAVMLSNEEVRDVLEDCDVNVELARERCEKFLRENIPVSDSDEPLNSGLFQRIMERAVLHAEHVGMEAVDLSDVLISLFEEKKSSAAYFLQHAGLTRIKLLRRISHGASGGFEAIVINEAEKEELLKSDQAQHEAQEQDEEQPPQDKKERYTLILDKFTTKLSDLARADKLDPLIGREDILERTMLFLGRRKKNNPIHVGDPGVGKTALTEGLAMRIANNSVPSFLRDFQIYTLDVTGLISGTRFRGDFEERMKMIMIALEKKKDVILFIDEIHTIIGAGAGGNGALDISNVLKPLFAAGEVRCIGATTHEEYRRYFEKDRALTRRFQKIDVPELNEDDAIRVLEGLRSHYEEYHNVRYAPGALEAAVRLGNKHINDRFLPDKAIDVIDECAVVVRMRHEQTRTQTQTNADEGSASDEHAPPPIEVDEATIEDVVARIAQIPRKRVTKIERGKLQNLSQELSGVIFGQDAAVNAVSEAIKRARAGFRATHKPIASFLFVGPTGVGKTELAKQLAEVMGIAFIRLDMSEYQERHTVSRLIGSPPGYVGYDEGAQLTDAVRKTPHAVLLLDEIEKAHPDIQHILLQIMDYATVSDNSGRKADFRNIVLIMTSNAGAREIGANVVGFDSQRRGVDASRSAIERIFSPEFRGRIDRVIFFNALARENVVNVVTRHVALINEQLAEKRISLRITPRCATWLAEESMKHDAGARGVERMIEEYIRSWFIDKILFEEEKSAGLIVTADHDGKKIVFKQKKEAGIFRRSAHTQKGKSE